MKVLIVVMTAIVCSIAVIGIYSCLFSEHSKSREHVICDLEVPYENQVEPELLPNYPEGDMRVAPDQEIDPDTEPEFPGGMSAFPLYVEKYQKMPAAARRAGIVGEVYLSFEVTERGVIRDIVLLKGLGFGCDEEAIRLIANMPRWKPAEEDGQFISSRFNLPVPFGKIKKGKSAQ